MLAVLNRRHIWPRQTDRDISDVLSLAHVRPEQDGREGGREGCSAYIRTRCSYLGRPHAEIVGLGSIHNLPDEPSPPISNLLIGRATDGLSPRIGTPSCSRNRGQEEARAFADFGLGSEGEGEGRGEHSNHSARIVFDPQTKTQNAKKKNPNSHPHFVSLSSLSPRQLRIH